MVIKTLSLAIKKFEAVCFCVVLVLVEVHIHAGGGGKQKINLEWPNVWRSWWLA